MKITKTKLEGVMLLEPKVFGDDRGYFVETFRQDKLEEALGYKVNFIQDNESKSSYGVFRGLHYQLSPFAQTKLVRVVEGSVIDIAVDLRKGSPTFGQHITVELSGENKLQLFIPRGFAHGFVVTSPTAVFSYKVDNYYAPECDRGVAYNDPKIGISLNIDTEKLLLSEKDKNQPLLAEADLFDYNDNLYK
ncbi:MAG TPA: dTDP-4-dehydrorhamnose 3,5-epimerase [Sulfurovum sp.]|nr:dTDP-4-dehydrorhamnose 3,5-epimerase [Sulfurovum sp.]